MSGSLPQAALPQCEEQLTDHEGVEHAADAESREYGADHREAEEIPGQQPGQEILLLVARRRVGRRRVSGELQGDLRERLREMLAAKGLAVKG